MEVDACCTHITLTATAAAIGSIPEMNGLKGRQRGLVRPTVRPTWVISSTVPTSIDSEQPPFYS